MLVLARRCGERFRVGDNLWVTLIRVYGDRAILGFEGGEDLPVMREELLLQRTNAKCPMPSASPERATP